MTARSLTPTALLLALVVAGCGSSSSTSSSSSSSSSSAAAATTTSTPAATTSSSSSASSSSSPSSGSSSAKTTVLALAASPSGALKYDKSSLAAGAGKITIDFTNKSPLPHDVVIADSSGKIFGRTPVITGKMVPVTVDLQAGTYTYYCSVPGHRQAGMQGTLTVK
jgi:plastocyanin